jgi:hypothetical protein
VVKQKDKSTGQLIDYSIEFGKKVVSKQEQEYSQPSPKRYQAFGSSM